MDPKLLRQHARDCSRLAEECVDLFTQETLHELAAEFRRAADAMEGQSGREKADPSARIDPPGSNRESGESS